MHTSRLLQSSDFRYWRRKQETLVQVDFDACFPDHHSVDRIGVVSPYLEDGARHAAYALLAATTIFYDGLRARGGEFFDYPYHFAFCDVTAEGVATQLGRFQLDDNHDVLGGPWAGLDVWPKSQWVPTSGRVEDMLQGVFDRQINCLFWPESLRPAAGIEPFPAYVRRLLKARLKTVYYYHTTRPNVEIHVNQTVEDVVREKSFSRLPESVRDVVSAERDHALASPMAPGFSYAERYRRVSVDAFLADMAPCFKSVA